MKKWIVLGLLCTFIVGCGGTWFPRSSNFGKKLQPVSPQETHYHHSTMARKRQGCVTTTGHLQPQLNRTIYGECVSRGSSVY